MTPELRSQLIEAHEKLPPDCRREPVSEAELQLFEADFGPIPSEFRWYLATCGGGVVGSEWVDGIADLRRSHEKFKAESDEPGGWSMKDVFIIGWNGGGNPFGIDRASGAILVEDHDLGGIHTMAASFEEFLVWGLEPSGPRKRGR